MTTRQWIAAGVACGVGIGAAAVPARVSAADQTETVLLRLEEKMADVGTVLTSFVQEKDMAVFKHRMIIRGTIAVARPGRIAWHVREPVRYSMVIRDSEVLQWDEDTDRVDKLDLADNPQFKLVLQQLTVWFSGQYRALLDDYTVAIDQLSPPVLTFTPKPDSMFSRAVSSVTVAFREDERYIGALTIREGNGDTTSIRFHDTHIGEPIPSAMWQVRPSGK